MDHAAIVDNFRAALAHHRAGRLDQAERLYRQILVHQPDNVDCLQNLAALTNQFGKNEQALVPLRQAMALAPKNAELYSILGVILKELNRLDDAAVACRQAMAINPSLPSAHSNLGNVLLAQHKLDEAITAYRRAIELKPDYPQALSNLGNALTHVGDFGAAVTACRKALALHPQYPQAQYNLGLALACLGRVQDSIIAYRRALAIKPDMADAHANLAHSLLLSGNFSEGFVEYEWRWRTSEPPPPRPNFPQPRWDGQPVPGKAIFIDAEQGLGDTIQFARLLPLVRQRSGAKLFFGCKTALQRLIQSLDCDCTVLCPTDRMPEVDFQIPLLSLPHALGITLEAIPAKVPYLFADHTDRQRWRARLSALPPGQKIGLCWAGNPKYKMDRFRSLRDLSLLAPLASAPNTTFISLQKGPCAEQSRNAPAGMRVIDWTADERDLADTAALVMELDLIITTDTAIAHLAGAIGKPVWLMLAHVPDWRWLMDREESPWYPTMRLFRQRTPFDWTGVVQTIAEELTREHAAKIIGQPS
jgi:Flp pilus assembly protein TadD